MSTYWWLLVIALAVSVAFVFGFIARNEFEVYNRRHRRGGTVDFTPGPRIGL